MKNIYFVYEYIDPFSNEVFYVGYGKGRRARAHLIQAKSKNPQKSHKIHKICQILSKGAEPTISYVASGLEREEAKKLEIKLIEKYGRRDLGTGTLTNMTSGGDCPPDSLYGNTFYKRVSNESRKIGADKISKRGINCRWVSNGEEERFCLDHKDHVNNGWKYCRLSCYFKEAKDPPLSTFEKINRNIVKEIKILRNQLLNTHGKKEIQLAKFFPIHRWNLLSDDELKIIYSKMVELSNNKDLLKDKYKPKIKTEKVKTYGKGRIFSDEHKEKIRLSKLGKVGNRLGTKNTPEANKNISNSLKGKAPSNKGKKMSKDFSKKMSELASYRRITCLNCKQEMNILSYARWHKNRCNHTI